VVVRSPEGFADDIPLDPPPVIFSSRRAFFRDFPPADLVVATYWATVPWVVRLLAARAGSATRAGFTPAYFVQDYEPAFYSPGTPLHAAARDTYALTPYAFAKTPWVRDRVAEAGGRISLVPPALDLDRFHPPDTPPEAPVVLAMLRPGTPRRGFETTVRVLRAIRAACPEARLEVFGCSDVDLAKRGVDLPLTNHGPTPNDALAPLYRSATVFLECSTFQAFGRTIAEALASGTPCVVTESGGPSLFVRHEENALVAAPGDADTLASHAVRLLTDRRLRARLAGNARPSVAGFERRRAAERARDCLHWFLTPGSDQGPPADFI
jgi:glycosyltransferase involved in cell wall biosynthesis